MKNKFSIKLQLSLLLISISIIAYQITLIQILSFVQWYHFAYMIISIAMLGFGAAGTILSLFKEKLLNRSSKILPRLMILSGLSMPAVVYLAQLNVLRFDTMLFFTGNYQLIRLLANYILFTIPFFLGALSIGIIFVKYVEDIGKLYFSNLVGSGIGGFLIIGLMWIFFPEIQLVVIGFLAVLSGLILSHKFDLEFYLLLIVSILFLLYSYLSYPQLQTSEFKSRSRTLLLQDAKVINSKTSPYGIVEIISSPMIRYAEGLSLKFKDEVKSGQAIFCNGDWVGPLVSNKNGNLNDLFNLTTSQLPFFLKERNSVLILNSGSGVDIQRSIEANSKTVVAVEPNISMVGVLTGEYSKLNDSAYLNKMVTIVITTSRSFILSNDEKFDLVILPTVDAFGGTSGLYSLREQYCLTKEAIGELLDRLHDDGVIMFNVWLDYPPRNSIKLFSTISEALEIRGVQNPIQHIAAIKNWNYLTILVKATPIADGEEEIIKNFCDDRLFDVVLAPNLKDQDRDKFNQLTDNQFYILIDKVFKSKREREELYNEYVFNILPAVDDKPFFSQFLRWKSIKSIIQDFGSQNFPFLELGYIFLYFTLIQIFIVALIFIVLPLIKIGFQANNLFAILIYFGGIGFGYMFLEIILIQMYTLYLGSPIYSASAVIGLMLVSSGLGSFVTYKSSFIYGKIRLMIWLITGLIIIQALLLKSILFSTIHFAAVIKVIIAAILIAPAAFLMGMLFPIGLRKISKSSSSVTAWALGINGFASVAATVTATIISIEFGFTYVFMCAAMFYSVILFSVKIFFKTES